MSRVLVTGATGFIGSHLARLLVAEGHDVVATVRPTSSLGRIADIQSQLSLYELRDGSLPGLFDGRPFEAVFHLATTYGRDDAPASRVVEANVLFPLRLLEGAIASSAKLFVTTDTSFHADYGFLRAYTFSKQHFAQWGKLLAETSDTRFVNLKLHQPYGPDDRDEKFAPTIIRQCLGTGDIALTPGEQRKDFVHVRDVARAYLALLARVDGLPPGASQFECGSGKAVSIREFVEMAHRLASSHANLRFGALPYRHNEVMLTVADTVSLANLGWSPTIPLEEGLSGLIRAALGIPRQ